MKGNDDMIWESRMLGGRTRINGCLYLPGCRAEYDTWGAGWAWDDISKFFMRSEGRLELESGKYDTGREGNEWKTRVIKPHFESSQQYVLPRLNELIDRFASALTRMGVPCLDVFDDPDTPTCFGLFQRRSMNAAGKRCSTYHAFLPKSLVRRRQNLTIVLDAHVQRILYSDNTSEVRATSLVVEGKHGQRFAVRARHEIILCGGAVVTPQLLMLRYSRMLLSLMHSGIGPKDHLSQVGKPCIQDLPGVGSTLVYHLHLLLLTFQQDHVYVPVSFYVPSQDSAHRIVANPFLVFFELIRFFLFGTGFFLSAISEYFCYCHTQRLPPNHDKTSHQVPDLELFWTAAYGSFTFPKFPAGMGAGSVMVQCSLPKSLGTVRLSPDGADDIKVDPIIDPKYLSAPEDWEVYRRGIVFAQQVGTEMRKGGYPIEEVQLPASQSKEDLDEHIRKFAIASQHLVSSCRMKPREEGGVVDQQLKVYGIEGLRIADGSVFPGMIASRPQATVVMIAERCADFIRQGWKEKGLFQDQ